MSTVQERRLAILNAIVEEYISTAQPISSVRVAQMAKLNVSTATVRNDMAALDREGFLAQPHTSSGRAPTEKGYRFYVDHLDRPNMLFPSQRQMLQKFFSHLHGEVDQLLERSANLLARLTDYSSIAIRYTKQDQSALMRSVQIVGMSERTGLIVVVLGNGSVQTENIEFKCDVSEATLSEASAILHRHLAGKSFNDVCSNATIPAEYIAHANRHVADLIDTVMPKIAGMYTASNREHVFIGGSSHIADAFDAIDSIRMILSMLEQQLVLVDIMERMIENGMSVAIGTSEHGNTVLADCTLIVTPIKIDSYLAGSLGLLGPVRMNYPMTLAIVNEVGARLSEKLDSDAG